MSKHARFSPSAAHRWIPCPGSIALTESLELSEGKTSYYAAEGTVAHWILEQSLSELLVPGGPLKKVIPVGASKEQDGYEVAITAELLDAVGAVTSYVQARLHPGKEVELERQVSLAALDGELAECWGTLDIGIHDPYRSLEIIDAKFGSGVIVEPWENWQLIIYALGYIAELQADVNEVMLTIAQPRARDGEPIKTWHTTQEELLDYLPAIREAMTTVAPDALDPGESQCQWCPAKARCPALAKAALDAAQSDFDDIDPPALNTLSNKQLAHVMNHKKLLEEWLSAVASECMNQIELGNEVPGWKLVAGRSSRAWKDPRKILALIRRYRLGKQLIEEKPVGIPAVEKALKKKGFELFNDLVVWRQAKNLLVPIEDKREALEFFTEVEEDEAARG